MINAITIIKKKQGLTYKKFQNYWKNEHAEIVTRSPLVGTYVQSHPIYNDELTFEDTIDGIAEIWFDDTNAMRSLAATKEYKDIQDDENVFIDGSAVRLIIAEDIITVEGDVSDYKLIIFMNKSSNVELTDFRNDLVDKASHYSKKNLNSGGRNVEGRPIGKKSISYWSLIRDRKGSCIFISRMWSDSCS